MADFSNECLAKKVKIKNLKVQYADIRNQIESALKEPDPKQEWIFAGHIYEENISKLVKDGLTVSKLDMREKETYNELWKITIDVKLTESEIMEAEKVKFRYDNGGVFKTEAYFFG